MKAKKKEEDLHIPRKVRLIDERSPSSYHTVGTKLQTTVQSLICAVGCPNLHYLATAKFKASAVMT